jgi:5'-deoxynucleotidase YfbR-like HD superfamily hydrolase
MTADAANTRLASQVAFLTDADKLKTILRRTPLTDNSRPENSAEHSWHLALAAMVLHEYAPRGTNLQRVLELVTIHDLVEIDAGDTFAYDVQAGLDKADREQAAADRIFGLLPRDAAVRARALWEEFEANESAEARFANALDRFQALLQNLQAGGGSWMVHHVTRAQVVQRMKPIEATLPALWPFVLEVIQNACEKGHITD